MIVKKLLGLNQNCNFQIQELATKAVSTESELKTQLTKGLQYQQNGDFEKALECYDKVIGAIPLQLDACYFKSIILLQMNRMEEAIHLLRPVLDQEPNPPLQEAFARCHRVAGSAQQQLGDLQAAIQHFRKALDLHPQEPDYSADLIQALLADSQLDNARNLAENLPAHTEQHLRCLAARAEVNWKDWRVDECLRYLQTAMKMAPAQLDLISQYLFAINYLEPDDPEIAALHISLGAALERHYRSQVEQHAPLAGRQSNGLRIGFLSPDLRNHSVSFFLLPLLRELSKRDDVWTAAYALNKKIDATTHEIERLCDQFIHMPGHKDLSAIETDRLDILVDLAGHTSGNCLPLLLTSPKPAPVVVNWLGYPNTTGFKYHDYRFVDTHTDPPEPEGQEPSSECKLYLDPSFLCYEPPQDSPKVNNSPATKNGFVTAGCFNNLNKITQTTLGHWATLLQKVPTLHLAIKSPFFQSEKVKQRILRALQTYDIDDSRIQLLERSPDTYTHLETYHHIDFTLDTFPYNGTTTTFESLYMGCPVITLQGRCHRSRVSASILINLGQSDWIANNAENYIAKAAELASSPEILSETRLSLRQDLMQSSLCNARKFTDSFLHACSRCKKPVN